MKIKSTTNYLQSDVGDNPYVNLASGRLRLALEGLSVGHGNYAVKLSHIYNSKPSIEVDDKFANYGNNWKLNVSQYMTFQGAYYYADEHGEVHYLTYFDKDRYYDKSNVKVVFSKNYSDFGGVLTDGVGNKLHFDANGLLVKSVSCHNSAICKEYVYDADSKLISVYDKRFLQNGVASTRIDLTYNTNGLLATMTAYVKSKQVAQLRYTYDEDGNLISVKKYKEASSSVNPTQLPHTRLIYKELYKMAYQGSLPLMIVNSETKSAYKFQYNDDGTLAKMEQGVFDNTVLSQDTMQSFVSLKSNTYSYDFSVDSGISVETRVTNENGVKMAYFFDRNACILSTFEMDSENSLKTLTPQRERNVVANPYSGRVTINNNQTSDDSNTKTYTLSNIEIARNDTEKNCKNFTFSFWLKTHNCYKVLEAKLTYQFGSSTYTSTVMVNSQAKYAWQRVSVPLTVPKNYNTKKLSKLQITMLANKSTVNCTDSFEVNPIGFASAPTTDMYLSNGVKISQITSLEITRFVNYDPVYEEKAINSSFYLTENDIIDTFTNRAAHSTYPQGKQMYDLIYNNGAGRLANVNALHFCVGSTEYTPSSSSPFYVTSVSPDNEMETTTQYNYSSSSMEIKTIGKKGNVVSSTSVKIDYKGKTLSETDEYGVRKEYEYDVYGDVKAIKFYDSNNVICDAFYYHYDEGKLLEAHDGVAGQQITYNEYDKVSSVTEGNVTAESGFVPTEHRTDFGYDNYRDRILSVTENGGDDVAVNQVTYNKGRIRTVSDGTVKYGVKYDDANRTVEYTQFDGNAETTLQKDYILTNSATGVQQHVSEIGNEKVTTKVNKYGNVLTVTKSNEEDVTYAYEEISESDFAHKPFWRICGTNTTEYSYDYDGNPVGFVEKENNNKVWEVRQVSPDVTRYDYPLAKYFATVVRDSNKTLNPRIASVQYLKDLSSNIGEFQTDYTYDSFGRIEKKENRDARFNRATTDYDYQPISGKIRLAQIAYNGLCNDGDVSQICKINYTSDYDYDAKGAITEIKNTFNWKKYNYENIAQQATVTNLRKYSYNALNQLESEKVGNTTKTYTYLPDGRLSCITSTVIRRIPKKTSYSYDSQGRLSSIGSREFSYDSYGNRTGERNGDTVKTYAYKHGLLTTTPAATYKYNADGVRCEKVHNGVTTKYQLDGNKIMGEVQSGAIPEIHSFNGKRYIRYFYDNEGIQYIKLGEVDYELVKDVLGNVVMVVAATEGKVACFYEYDAFGNCTVLDANGNKDTDPTSIGNANPIRWKGFYYDTETGFYYANGSYYDPTTGTYLDASPISAVIDNALTTRSLDRNAPVCNNILELAGNPYTVANGSGLSPDPAYDPYKNAPWYIKAAVWFSKIAWYKKLFIGVMLLAFAVLFTVISGGSIPALLYGVAKGVLLGIGFWAVSTLFVGEKLTWEGLGNAALDAFLVTSAIAFVTSAVSFIKCIARSNPVTTAELTNAELKSFGEPGKNQGFRQTTGTHKEAMKFVRSQTKSLTEYSQGKYVGYNSIGVEFRVYARPEVYYTSIRITGVEGLKGIKFMWP